MKTIHLAGILLFLSIAFGCQHQTELEVTETRCESLINPVGIDNPQPVFSWIAESEKRGTHQTACQVILSDNKKDISRNKGTLWNSGKISEEKNTILYSGPSLESNRIYYWKVRIWNENGQASIFSNTTRFTTSILDHRQWQASWIGRGIGKDPVNSDGFYQEKIVVDEEGDSVKYDENSLLLRKEYQFSKQVEQAIVHVSGLGLYELTINGEKIGKKVLNPAKTNYNKIVLYDTYDVSENLRKEANAIGLILGNGWFNPVPKWWSWRMQWFGEKRALLQMHIRFSDGSTQVITTDDSWKIADGPVRHHCIYDGETYDATKEIEGWDEPAFDDSAWENAKIVNSPRGELKTQVMPAVRRNEILKPVNITYPGDSLALIDFGQNFSGWIRIKIDAEKGQHIVIRYAENEKNGTLDTKTNGRALAADTYIAKGMEEETCEPRFTYHGFRYATIKGLDYRIQPNDIEGIVIHSAVKPSGAFSCSNEQINNIQKAIIWSQRANLMGYPTDCPQREERLGWIGDAHVVAEEAIFNFDMNQFYRKWLNDIRTNQNDSSGYIPYIAPRPLSKNDPAFSWSSGYHLITWYHYLYYGDKRILTNHFEAMKKYVDYLSSLTDDHILPNDKYGDWVSPLEEWKRGMPESTSTGYYFYVTTIVAKVSKILGYSEETQKYSAQADSIKRAFNWRYYNSGKNNYDDGSQFANSFALFLGIVPGNEKEAVLNYLVDDIMNTHEGHLSTGILGTKYIMELLTREGRSDIAWKMATQPSYPGWIDMLKNKTTLSERWDQSGSNNHVMLGSIGSWFYKCLAGIQVDEAEPGAKHIFIRPYMPSDLDWVKASTKTVMGEVKSEWLKTNGTYNLKVKIPFGSEAKVYVLAKSVEEVKESGGKATEAEGVKYVKMENGYAIFNVGSGEYNFIANAN